MDWVMRVVICGRCRNQWVLRKILIISGAITIVLAWYLFRRLALIFVPGVGFSRSGLRLGQGGGFYDCVLSALAASANGTRTVGVAFHEQDCLRLFAMNNMITPVVAADLVSLTTHVDNRSMQNLELQFFWSLGKSVTSFTSLLDECS